jgi:hypothetical protein
MIVPHTSCLARSQLVSSLTKNTASGNQHHVAVIHLVPFTKDIILKIKDKDSLGAIVLLFFHHMKVTLGQFHQHFYIKRK